MTKAMKITKENLESVVQAYVLGQLDDTQTEEFEAYFLARPELIEMIDLAQKLNTGLENLPFESVVAAEQPNNRSLLDMLVGFIKTPVPVYAAVAALAVVALGPASLLSSNDAVYENQPQLVRLDTSSVRSAGKRSSVDLSVDGKSAALVVRVKEVEFPQYRLKVLSSDDRETLWSSEVFEFASGTRDYLVVVPPQASRNNVKVELYGVDQGDGEVNVTFCNYTEACF